LQRSLLLLTFCLFLGCNSYKEKTAGPDEGPLNLSSIDFQFVSSKVLGPRCVRCHSLAGGDKGDVNLETYENVVAHLAEIEESVFREDSMPPRRAGGPLTAYEKNILRLWIDARAPEENHGGESTPPSNPTPIPAPSPSPTPGVPLPPPADSGEPVAPTWEAIYEKIFAPKCIRCHAEGEKAGDYPLQDKAFVSDPANLLVVPGDYENSEIYMSITRQDKRRMPPPKTGLTLTSQEIEAIKIWILNGAKD